MSTGTIRATRVCLWVGEPCGGQIRLASFSFSIGGTICCPSVIPKSSGHCSCVNSIFFLLFFDSGVGISVFFVRFALFCVSSVYFYCTTSTVRPTYYFNHDRFCSCAAVGTIIWTALGTALMYIGVMPQASPSIMASPCSCLLRPSVCPVSAYLIL